MTKTSEPASHQGTSGQVQLSRGRRNAFRAVSACLVLTLGLGAGEVFVRAAGLAPGIIPIELTTDWGTFVASPNPQLGWVPRPATGDINSYGIRDREYPIKKPDGAYRVVVIGDSIGYGLCVSNLDDLFHSRVEVALTADPAVPYDPVELINLSVSGYDTEQQVEFLKEKGLALGPDLVLVSFCLNDYEDATYELRAFEEKPGWGWNQQLGQAMRRRAFMKSHLVRLAILRWPSFAERFGKQIHAEMIAEDTQLQLRDRVTRSFEALKDLADQHGFGVLVVVWPNLENLNDNYARPEYHARVRAAAEAEGFEVLDLFDPLAAATDGGDATPLRCDRWHPNEEGNRVAAEAVAEYLEPKLSGPVPIRTAMR